MKTYVDDLVAGRPPDAPSVLSQQDLALLSNSLARASGEISRLTLPSIVGDEGQLISRNVRALMIRSVEGNLTVHAEDLDELVIDGPIRGNLTVAIAERSEPKLRAGLIVVGGGDRQLVLGRGVVEGKLTIAFAPSHELIVQPGSRVGEIHLHGPIGSVMVRAEPHEPRSYDFGIDRFNLCNDSSTVARDLVIESGVREAWLMGGQIVGDVVVSTQDGLRLDGGRFDGSVFIHGSTKLETLPRHIGKDLVIAGTVDLARCRMAGLSQLEHVRIGGSPQFSRKRRGLQLRKRVILADDDGRGGASLAETYRQVRESLAQNFDRDLSLDLYYREMRARLRSTKSLDQWFILAGYRLMSSFGTRALLPIAWLLILTAAFTIGIGADTAASVVLTSASDRVLFSLETGLNFWNPTDLPEQSSAVLKSGQILFRFAGILLLSQAALAIRDRVKR